MTGVSARLDATCRSIVDGLRRKDADRGLSQEAADDSETREGVGTALGGRRGVSLREGIELWLTPTMPEGVTEVLLGRGGRSRVAVAEADGRLVFRMPSSSASNGALLLLDRLVNLDTCGALVGRVSDSPLLGLVGSLEFAFFFAWDEGSVLCGGCRKWDRKVEAIVRLRQTASLVPRTVRESRRRSLGHLLCDVVGLVLGAALCTWAH